MFSLCALFPYLVSLTPVNDRPTGFVLLVPRPSNFIYIYSQQILQQQIYHCLPKQHINFIFVDKTSSKTIVYNSYKTGKRDQQWTGLFRLENLLGKVQETVTVIVKRTRVKLKYKSCPLNVSRWSSLSNTFFPKLVSVILVCSYHTDACPSSHFCNKFFLIIIYLMT